MLDALCLIGLLSFFGFLIYSTVIRAPKEDPVPTSVPLPPSPVGLFCSLCRTPAGMVNHEEYMRITRAGTPVYCEGCMTSIEAYKRQQAVR